MLYEAVQVAGHGRGRGRSGDSLLSVLGGDFDDQAIGRGEDFERRGRVVFRRAHGSGSWCVKARRLAPAARHTSIPYSIVLWPQPIFCGYSAAVYCESWMTRSAPVRNSTCRWSRRLNSRLATSSGLENGSWSQA